MLFAGEVFPLPLFRDFRARMPAGLRYCNLYGPTETNVCTFFEIPRTVAEDRDTPYPIGHTCSHLEAMVVDEQNQVVSVGMEGELVVRGPAVTQGYWNLPERNAEAFLIADDAG